MGFSERWRVLHRAVDAPRARDILLLTSAACSSIDDRFMYVSAIGGKHNIYMGGIQDGPGYGRL
jgi:hypothetical protein